MAHHVKNTITWKQEEILAISDGGTDAAITWAPELSRHFNTPIFIIDIGAEIRVPTESTCATIEAWLAKAQPYGS